jgi:hypothetical protein
MKWIPAGRLDALGMSYVACGGEMVLAMSFDSLNCHELRTMVA